MKKIMLVALMILSLTTAAAIAQNPADPLKNPTQVPVSNPFVSALEAKLGRPLSVEQKQLIESALQTLSSTLKQHQNTLIQKLADITKLSPESIQKTITATGSVAAKLPKDLIPKIENLLGRKLNPMESLKVQAADAQHAGLTNTAKNLFTDQTSKTTGLGTSEIKNLLPLLGF